MERGSRALLRDINVSLLIESFAVPVRSPALELARQSGLSAPTVSTIAGQLLERGIFIEVATAP